MRERTKVRHFRATLILGTLVVGIAGTAVAHGGGAFGPTKSEHWGVITRNTIGSPVAQLRDGPFGSFGHTGDAAEPPFGKGSLGLEVAAVPGSVEKVDFGNEVDFFGDPIAALNAVGFRVFQTGENAAISPTNMPNIRFEIDPPGGSTYSTMVWVPDAVPVASLNEWSGYLDATTTGDWYFTGGFGASSGCNQATMCSFAIAKSLATGGTIYTVQVGKGRDNAWVGAIDGLRLNSTITNFEAGGVRSRHVGNHDDD